MYKYKTRLFSSLVSASPEHGGKCRALRGDRGKSAYTGQNRFLLVLLTLIICFFVSAHAYPFRRLSPPPSPSSGDGLRFLFFLFATKQAGTAFSHEPFLYFFVFAHTYFYSFVSTHTCPFRQPEGRHLPRVRGRLFRMSHFFIFCFFYIKNIISFFLSRLLPPHTEGSAEQGEAIGASLRTQVRIVFCWFCSYLPLPST